jgi:hypothetical protein
MREPDRPQFGHCVQQQEADPQLAELAVIVITAAADGRVNALAPRTVLPKPVPFERLLSAVEQHC